MAAIESGNTVKLIIHTRPTQHFATNIIRINLSDDTISVFIPRNQKEDLINNKKSNGNLISTKYYTMCLKKKFSSTQ
jgi:hypothetical protein